MKGIVLVAGMLVLAVAGCDRPEQPEPPLVPQPAVDDGVARPDADAEKSDEEKSAAELRERPDRGRPD